MSHLQFLPFTTLARMVRSREISSEALMAAHLGWIERVNPRIRAVTETDGERALEAARECDRRTPREDEPFYGVPMTVKGAWDWAGMRNSGGTVGMREHYPPRDAPVIARMRRAGAIPVAATNVPELSLAFESDNLLYGRTNNPYDLQRTAGGSGGGGAAAIAAGCSPVEIGGDMAGSIRVPAHCCGIAGLKPTLGRVPLTGYLPRPFGVATLFACAGPLARTVDDLAAVLPVIAGPDGADANAVPARLRHPGGYRIGSGRIGVLTGNGVCAVTPETAKTVIAAARALAESGVPVEEARPDGMEECFDLQWDLLGADGGRGLEQISRDCGTVENHGLFEGFVETLRPRACDAGRLLELLARRDQFRSRMAAFFTRYDALLLPACAFPALPHGYTVARMAAFSYTSAFNLGGSPAAVVRCGTSSEGLPIAVQVAAGAWREDIALAIAAELERHCGGYRPPALSFR